MNLIKNVLIITTLLANPISAKQPVKQVEMKRQVAQKAPKNKKTEAQKNFGMATDQNKRDYQEDRFDYDAIITDKHNFLIADKYNFFGIYDGHGGDKTSSYLKENLASFFVDSLIRKPTIKDALLTAFWRAEFDVTHRFDDGSTVVTAYIDKDNNLHLAWVGDSRAVLEKNGTVDFETQDHKPDSKNELDRIERADGKIHKDGVWRINGLAISRSIGDRNLKEGKRKGQIIAVPEYAKIKLSDDNHFLIMASDGLWDVFKNQEAIDFVKGKIKTKDLDLIALDLKNEAIKRNSSDNITVCIVMLNELKEISAPSRLRQFWNWLSGN